MYLFIIIYKGLTIIRFQKYSPCKPTISLKFLFHYNAWTLSCTKSMSMTFKWPPLYLQQLSFPFRLVFHYIFYIFGMVGFQILQRQGFILVGTVLDAVLHTNQIDAVNKAKTGTCAVVCVHSHYNLQLLTKKKSLSYEHSY